MAKSKNVTAASTRSRRNTNSKKASKEAPKKGPKKGSKKGSKKGAENGAKSASNINDSGFSSGSSSNNIMEQMPEVPNHIQEAAHRLMLLKRGELFNDELVLPSIEPNDLEDEHYRNNSYEVEDSESMRQEDSDVEIILPTIEPEDYEFATPRASLKRKRSDSQTTDSSSDSGPQTKKPRRKNATRGVKAASRVTSGSVSDGYIKPEPSDEARHFEEETTYCEDTPEAPPAEAPEDTPESAPAQPKFEYVDEDDMDSFHAAALMFLREKIAEDVDYFHKLVGPKYPAYKAVVDIQVYRRRSWAIPNKEGRQLYKLLVTKK